MPVFVADIPAKLNSSQLSRPTADVTVVDRRKSASSVQIIIMLWATSQAYRRHICEPESLAWNVDVCTSIAQSM